MIHPSSLPHDEVCEARGVVVICFGSSLLGQLRGSVAGWLVSCLVGWLVDWLVVWLVGWMIGWLAGWVAGWFLYLLYVLRLLDFALMVYSVCLLACWRDFVRSFTSSFLSSLTCSLPFFSWLYLLFATAWFATVLLSLGSRLGSPPRHFYGGARKIMGGELWFACSALLRYIAGYCLTSWVPW